MKQQFLPHEDEIELLVDIEAFWLKKAFDFKVFGFHFLFDSIISVPPKNEKIPKTKDEGKEKKLTLWKIEVN